MGVGDIVTSDGVLFEVVWAGKGPLLPPRTSKAPDTWEPPLRAYNKTGRHTRKVVPTHGCSVIDNPDQSTLPSVGLIAPYDIVSEAHNG